MNLFAQIQEDNNENLYQVNENQIKTYRILPTVNMSYFIKLNTRNGQMWHIKFDQRKTNQLETPLSNFSLVEKQNEVDNRFILYPSRDRRYFLLLDQINGKIWQVNWDERPEKNNILPINNSSLIEKENTMDNRFTLYLTRNSWNFILLDKINGNLWQINWSSKPGKSEIIPI